MTSPFLGADFRIQSVNPIGVATLRLRFTQDPEISDDSDGSLNIDNYTITGPAINYVTGASQVVSDPQAVDLFLAAPLEIGQWTLFVANVVGELGAPLEIPTSLTFTVTRTAVEEPVPRGAVNDSSTNILRKFLNPAIKGPNTDRILRALAAGDAPNWENSKLAFDQLFIPSASGIYLERRAADEGVRKPEAISMADELFRELTIISKTRKLTQDAILEILEVFYGADAVRAFVETRLEEPFALEHLDELRLSIDEQDEVIVVFDRAQFGRIGLATATEVAASISRQLKTLGYKAYAVDYTDETGRHLVRIHSGRLGLSSSVRVIGGKAQVTLGFQVDDEDVAPDYIFPVVGGTPYATWDITASTETIGDFRFTLDGSSATFDDFNKLIEGDYVLVYGQEFELVNRGTFQIKSVGIEYPGPTQWFEIENVAGTVQADVVQLLSSSLQFHRSKKRTIYNEDRYAVVSQTNGITNIIMPATTQAVRRTEGNAAYHFLPEAKLVGTSDIVRGNDPALDGDHVKVTTTDPHGLAVGNWVLVEGANITDMAEPTSAAGGAGQSDASKSSHTTQITTFSRTDHKGVRLDSGIGIFVGGRQMPADTADKGPVAFRITNTTYDSQGRRQVNYTWTTLGHSPTINPIEFGISQIDNRLLVTGGCTSAGTPTDGWDLIEYTVAPAINTMVSGVMPTDRASHAQATFDDKAMICGGFEVSDTVEVKTAYEFDFSTQIWTAIPDMAYERMQHGAVAVSDGVIVMGGRRGSDSVVLQTTEFWDGAAWTEMGPLQFARYDFTAIPISNDRVLILGGRGYDPTRNPIEDTLSSCEIYDRHTRLWSSISDMPTAREFPAATYVDALNAVVVHGGPDSTDIEILDLKTLRWRTSLASSLSARTQDVALNVDDDDIVIFAGGMTSGTSTAINNLLVPAAESLAMGGLNGTHRITAVPTVTSFVYKTPGYDGLTTSGGEDVAIYPVGAQVDADHVVGPYVFDPKGGLAITDIEGTIDIPLQAGHQYLVLPLETGVDPEPALQFPDEPGWLVFNFGYEDQIWPVRYMGRISDTELALDAAFVFPSDIPAGAGVHWVAQREAFVPDDDSSRGALYLTASSAGRVAASEFLDDTVAAGLPLNKEVIYPGDKGLGGEGYPKRGNYKITDAVRVWGGDDLAAEIATAQSDQDS